MKSSTSTKIFLASALVISAFTANAQTSNTAGAASIPSATASQPNTAVGVTPQAAAEANRKAVPRSDTATVVRTSPSATDSARNATDMSAPIDGKNTQSTTLKARADRN